MVAFRLGIVPFFLPDLRKLFVIQGQIYDFLFKNQTKKQKK